MATERTKAIFDLVDGIYGTYIDTITEGVDPDNPDLDNPCRIEYHPPEIAFGSIREELSYLVGRGSGVVSNRVYPKEAIKHIPRGSKTEQGVMNEYVVITEDQHRNQYFLSKIHEEFKQSITEMAERLSQEQKGRMEQQIENMEKKEEAKQDDKPSRSRNRSPQKDEISDLF